MVYSADHQKPIIFSFLEPLTYLTLKSKLKISNQPCLASPVLLGTARDTAGLQSEVHLEKGFHLYLESEVRLVVIVFERPK